MKPSSSRKRRIAETILARVTKTLAGLRVGHQVELAVARRVSVSVRPWCFSGGGRSDFASSVQSLDRDRQLAAAGLEDRAVGAEQVAEVERRGARSNDSSPRTSGAPAAGCAPCGRRGRGTPSCPGRDARAGGRRRARARRSPRRLRVPHAAPWRPRSASRPRRRAGTGRSPPPAVLSSLRRRTARSSWTPPPTPLCDFDLGRP